MNDFVKAFRLGITDEQLNEFIHSIVKTVDDKTMNNILSNLDDDVKQVYNEALNPVKNKQILSQDKFRKEFCKLIVNLEGYISELGDEEGEYCDSEDRWSHYEFDEISFSCDIEEIFSKILPLLNDAYKYKSIKKDYFIDLIYKIEDGIESYPEWTGAEYSDWSIEEKGAEVIVKWLWLHKESIDDFIAKANETIKNNNITNNFKTPFINEITDDEKQALYSKILKHKKEWQEELNNTNHFLHNIFHIVTQVGDKDSFIKESIQNIVQKWHYGIDVYKYYLDEKDYKNSEKYISQTITEFYNQYTSKTINSNIEEVILPFYKNRDDDRIDSIFKDWLSVLEKLKDDKKHKLITVQYQAFLTPCDYDKIINSVIENKTNSYENYINEIKISFIQETLSYNRSSINKECWLGNMIDFIVSNDKQSFIDKVKQWLLLDFKEPLKSYYHGLDYELLMILTNDLLPNLKLIKKHKIFYQQVFNNKKSVFSCMTDKSLTSFRELYLKSAGMQELEEEILNAWSDNVEKFIPCPSTASKARYASHAKWLAIAKELNSKIYNKVYADWKTNQFRKRNLWAELSQYGITK